MGDSHGFTMEFAIDLARQAGQIMTAAFDIGMERRLKADGTHLTWADTAINALVIREVRRVCPGVSILAEEGSMMIPGSEYTVVCDPIDGTTAFSHGIPTCAFSLALVHCGGPVVGVIHDPFLGRMFSAKAGGGAFLNGRPIRVSTAETVGESVIGTVWWPGEPYRLDQVTRTLMETGARTVDVGSIAYMGALVAAGELSGAIFPGDRPWDTVALKVIVEEAGGRVTDVFGQDQRYDGKTRGVIASNGRLHAELLQIVAAQCR